MKQNMTKRARHKVSREAGVLARISTLPVIFDAQDHTARSPALEHCVRFGWPSHRGKREKRCRILAERDVCLPLDRGKYLQIEMFAFTTWIWRLENLQPLAYKNALNYEQKNLIIPEYLTISIGNSGSICLFLVKWIFFFSKIYVCWWSDSL